MDGTMIAKHPEDWPVAPNLVDYEATSAAFTWEAARKELGGACFHLLPGAVEAMGNRLELYVWLVAQSPSTSPSAS